MAPKFPLLVGAILVLVVVMKPPTVQSKDSKPNQQGFNFLQHLDEGCHKGQTVKGLHQLKLYLQKFGYLNYSHSLTRVKNDDDDDEFDDLLESAIKIYQENHHLTVTGNLDSETVKEMMLPRCGVPDIINGTNSLMSYRIASLYSFFPGRQRWPLSKTRLTYGFSSSAPVVVGEQVLRSVCSRAFKRWEDSSHFTFQEAPLGSNPDIVIGFHHGHHGDGTAFDGPTGILAHAAAPMVGWFHYDADENWSTNPGMDEVDLESVAVHEIGHLLGLGHSGDKDAVMYAQFSYGSIKRDLHHDDIKGIRVLYS